MVPSVMLADYPRVWDKRQKEKASTPWRTAYRYKGPNLTAVPGGLIVSSMGIWPTDEYHTCILLWLHRDGTQALQGNASVSSSLWLMRCRQQIRLLEERLQPDIWVLFAHYVAQWDKAIDSQDDSQCSCTERNVPLTAERWLEPCLVPRIKAYRVNTSMEIFTLALPKSN